jgi:glyoxylase-like metal-dependent hydrolase (beta-lactamase superfamily II)
VIRKVVLSVLGFVLVSGVILLAATVPARWQIQHINPQLPDWTALDAALNQPGGPLSLAYINTASQATTLGELGHPAIVIDWPDGRRFLIDTGMPPAQAQAFGKPMELLGAGPTRTFGAVDAQLGNAVQSVKGIAFTHLHSDHTAGLPGICAAQSQAATVYQAPLQQQELNYTTEIGLAALDDAVCPRAVLGEDVIMPVPGFPGLLAVSLGGHTPGSTLYAVRVAGKTWIFSGDITNDLRSLQEDIPKPWWYSTLVVPENVGRTAELRAWLKNLDAQPDVTVLPAHDVVAMAAAGLQGFNG